MSFDSLADLLAQRMLEQRHKQAVAIVAIDGFGCCGKSTLAQALAVRTGAASLETDDFQQPDGGLIEPASPLSYRRWSALQATAIALALGQPARYAAIDWETHKLQTEVEVQPKPILIVDGIGAHALRFPTPPLRVFVDGHARSRMQRVAARDGAKHADWDRYVMVELAYFERYKPWRTADLFVIGAELTFGNSSEGFARLLERAASELTGRLDRPYRP